MALKESCLLSYKLDDLAHMKVRQQIKQAGGGSFVEDHRTLFAFLQSNFESKNEWRDAAKILNKRGYPRKQFLGGLLPTDKLEDSPPVRSSNPKL